MKVDPVQLAALDQAQRINDALNMRAGLSDALAKSLVEGLEGWVQIAQSQGHPQQVPARYWVSRLVNVLEQARAANSGLQLADRIPGGGNGRTERPNAG